MWPTRRCASFNEILFPFLFHSKLNFGFCPEQSEFLCAYAGGRIAPRKPGWYTRIAFNCCQGMKDDMSACMPLCHSRLFTPEWINAAHAMGTTKSHWQRHLHSIIYAIVALFRFLSVVWIEWGWNETNGPRMFAEWVFVFFRSFRMKELSWRTGHLIPACFLYFYAIKEIGGPKLQPGQMSHR